jgi:ABC-type dipeptide/oligopeptide/nickel transport system ATPase component
VTALLLDVRDLRVSFPMANGMTEAVRGVSFSVAPGEAIGIVGESGSGKSVSALAVMRLVAQPGRITGGEILFAGRDLAAFDEKAMRTVRGRHISMVFQDPLSSLNPAFTIGQQLVDTVRAHRPAATREAARDRAVEVLELVGITEAGRRLSSYPHEFSGGMRQRVMIALAIACEPKLLIADEPTTALDVTIQAQVVTLLWQLREKLGLSVLFISHNLDLVAEICDRVYVMHTGNVVEHGDVEDIFLRPQHSYTRMLQNCIPRIEVVEPWGAAALSSAGEVAP